MIEHHIEQPENRKHDTPILLLHGAWHGAWCWENWVTHFASLGYEVHTINLPAHGQNKAPKHINLYTLNNYVQTLANAIDTISPTPIVIGHSMGGAVLQKYLETHTLPAAVLLATVPSKGILPLFLRLFGKHPIAVLKSLFTLNLYHWVGTPKLAHELFLLPQTAVDIPTFHTRLVRESLAVGLQLMLPFAKRNPQATPMQVIAGEFDQVFTVAEEKATANKYDADYLLIKGQPHNLMMDSAWQEVADQIDEWIQQTLHL